MPLIKLKNVQKKREIGNAIHYVVETIACRPLYFMLSLKINNYYLSLFVFGTFLILILISFFLHIHIRHRLNYVENYYYYYYYCITHAQTHIKVHNMCSDNPSNRVICNHKYRLFESFTSYIFVTAIC